MFDKVHLQTILKINGLTASASDDQVRSVLLSARYHEAEIATALQVLRNTAVIERESDPSSKLFRSDGSLNPDDISRLLGVVVEVKRHDRSDSHRAARESRRSLFGQLIVMGIAAAVGIMGLVVAMYIFEFGVFHPTAALLQFHVGR